MSDGKNIIANIKENKKAIGENLHIVSIILLVAFILFDILIIIYLLHENDKYHVIYPDVSKIEATQIRDYLVTQGIEASLDKAGKVVVPKESVALANQQVEEKFDFNKEDTTVTTPSIVSDEKVNQEVDLEQVLAINDLEQQVTESLENHVGIKTAKVRIDDFASDLYDVTVTVVITPTNGIGLQKADLDTFSWLVSSLIDGCKEENITLINALTNSPFEE